MRRFVKLAAYVWRVRGGTPPRTPRLFGPLVLRAQKELDKSLEDGHRKWLAVVGQQLIFDLGWVLVTQIRSFMWLSCEIMWNHVKIQNCFLHTLSDSVNSRNTCEVDWIDIRSYECFSDASRDYKSGEIHVNSCEIMWKSITGFLELTTFWYGLCGLQDHLRSTLHRYSKLRTILRCLPRLQISWNSCEIMWNHVKSCENSKLFSRNLQSTDTDSVRTRNTCEPD